MFTILPSLVDDSSNSADTTSSFPSLKSIRARPNNSGQVQHDQRVDWSKPSHENHAPDQFSLAYGSSSLPHSSNIPSKVPLPSRDHAGDYQLPCAPSGTSTYTGTQSGSSADSQQQFHPGANIHNGAPGASKHDGNKQRSKTSSGPRSGIHDGDFMIVLRVDPDIFHQTTIPQYTYQLRVTTTSATDSVTSKDLQPPSVSRSG